MNLYSERIQKYNHTIQRDNLNPQDVLNATQGSLNATQDVLNATQGYLNATQDVLNALKIND